jgi:hypothetical protein
VLLPCDAGGIIINLYKVERHATNFDAPGTGNAGKERVKKFVHKMHYSSTEASFNRIWDEFQAIYHFQERFEVLAYSGDSETCQSTTATRMAFSANVT